MNYILETRTLHIELDDAALSLVVRDQLTGERLLILSSLHVSQPVLDGQPAALSFAGVEQGSGGVILHFAGEAGRLQVSLAVQHDAFVLGAQFAAARACHLNRWELLPQGTGVNLYDVVNFRNRHHTPRTWPELLLGGAGCRTDTFSGDWQFAPHPSLLMLRKNATLLLLGALDLPRAFGLHFAAKDYRVQHCFLDYGAGEHGQILAAGETVYAPRFCLLHEQHNDENGGVDGALDRYADLLRHEGLVPEPATRTRFAWHREPLYCTWMDQGYVSGTRAEAELAAQGGRDVLGACTEELVRRALRVMDEQRLPFRTVLIDDGWQKARGQWEPHPERFPDLRRLVDDIHARGQKAIVWWTWAEIFDDADVDPAHLIGGGRRNRHGQRVRDYSLSATQTEYLEPLFHKLFSSDADCYDLDGVKTDFLADKVHADMPVSDPNWRGEENYCFHVFALCDRLMRQFKPDACHIGCAGHPFLAQFIDINRTYDISSSNVREHENRALMLTRTAPGVPVAFDFHNCVEHLADYFGAARAGGFSVQVGSILGMMRDPLSGWETADAAFYDILRRGLAGAITHLSFPLLL